MALCTPSNENVDPAVRHLIDNGASGQFVNPFLVNAALLLFRGTETSPRAIFEGPLHAWTAQTDIGRHTFSQGHGVGHFVGRSRASAKMSERDVFATKHSVQLRLVAKFRGFEPPSFYLIIHFSLAYVLRS
jgi:hypothetical protein